MTEATPSGTTFQVEMIQRMTMATEMENIHVAHTRQREREGDEGLYRQVPMVQLEHKVTWPW